MNKPTIVALAVLAVFFSATAASYQTASAQYGVPGSPVKGATPEQLKECEQYGIGADPATGKTWDPASCTENAILAKRRVTASQETTYGDKAYGSGTAYFKGGETWIFIGVLAAIFGGVAAAFFFRGRGATPPS